MASRVLISHSEVQQWAEERGAKPARVNRPGEGDFGVIYLDFAGTASAEGNNLEEISWEDFFDKFNQSQLALLIEDDELASGGRSNFHKLIGRETSEAAVRGEKMSPHASRAQRAGSQSRNTLRARARRAEARSKTSGTETTANAKKTGAKTRTKTKTKTTAKSTSAKQTSRKAANKPAKKSTKKSTRRSGKKAASKSASRPATKTSRKRASASKTKLPPRTPGRATARPPASGRGSAAKRAVALTGRTAGKGNRGGGKRAALRSIRKSGR